MHKGGAATVTLRSRGRSTGFIRFCKHREKLSNSRGKKYHHRGTERLRILPEHWIHPVGPPDLSGLFNTEKMNYHHRGTEKQSVVDRNTAFTRSFHCVYAVFSTQSYRVSSCPPFHLFTLYIRGHSCNLWTLSPTPPRMPLLRIIIPKNTIFIGLYSENGRFCLTVSAGFISMRTEVAS